MSNTRILTLPAVLLLLSGCVQWPLLRPSDPDSARTDSLVQRVDERLKAKQQSTAQTLVALNLDVAIERLRHMPAWRTPSDAERLLARVVDERLGHPVDDGWTARLNGKGRGGLQHAEETLTRARDLWLRERWDTLRELLVKQQSALAAFPDHAIRTDLMLVKAQDQLGEYRLAGLTWQEAVVSAVKRAPGWLDPGLWQELVLQRPLPTPWPPEVNTTLTALLPEALHDLPANPSFAAEALVWYAISRAYAERGDAAAAAKALRRSRTSGLFPRWDDFLTQQAAGSRQQAAARPSDPAR